MCVKLTEDERQSLGYVLDMVFGDYVGILVEQIEENAGGIQLTSGVEVTRDVLSQGAYALLAVARSMGYTELVDAYTKRNDWDAAL